MGSGRFAQKAVKRVGEAGENHWCHLRQKIWRLDSCNLNGALASESTWFLGDVDLFVEIDVLNGVE